MASETLTEAESRDLSLTDWSVMAVLAEQPRHGFAVARELSSREPLGAIWRVARPQVYRTLERVVALGYAELGPNEPGDGPQRRTVRLTPVGKAAVERWATTPVDRLRHLRSALLMKLVTCRRLGLDGPDVIDRQIDVVANIRQRLVDDLAVIHDDRRIALLWRLANADAAQRFLETAKQWWEEAA